ncbi:MAG: ABC transporter permease [Burkholderiales bacterium]|nr:ABC transporter permease [Burkholderiales bacterium]
MSAYVIRRLVYGLFVLVGVNVLTFALFFFVNSPDDMARAQLGAKRVTAEAVDKWKRERGYDKPLFLNDKMTGIQRATETVFFDKSLRLFAFQFGASDQGRNIGYDIGTRMWPSLAVQLPAFVIGLAVYISFALLMAFFRATYIDFWGVVLCVLMMSVSTLFYIIGGQFVFGKLWSLVPISGYDGGFEAVKFLVLPVLIIGIGGSARWLCDILEEIVGFTCAPRARRELRAARAVPPRAAERDDPEGLTGVVRGDPLCCSWAR